MANPTARRSIRKNSGSNQVRLQLLPLGTRRCAAWAVEVSLVVASALVPLGIGLYTIAKPVGERVPLNSVLAVTEEAIARPLGIPIGNLQRNVTPLTNWFWSTALLAPLALTSWQFYLLSKTGSTSIKRWFGVRVVTADGKPLGLGRVLLREGVGRWGLPLSIAYLGWRYGLGYPNLGLFALISWLLVLGEGISYRFHRQHRCFHDRIAGTYVVDATHPILGNLNGQLRGDKTMKRDTSYYWTEADEDDAIAAIVLTPEYNRQRRSLWRWMRQNPGLTLVLVAVFSMAVVLGTLVGTQVYIQTQANQREFDKQTSQQFLTLVKQLSPNSPATLDERRSAILALGTINNPQALQLLVDLLGQETSPTLLDAIQQSLASAGLKAMPYLQRLNQSLSNELESLSYSGTSPNLAVHARRLQATQQAIAKILVIYSGQIHGIDLSRTNLGQNLKSPAPFTLVLDKVDLSGVQLAGANLSNASLRDSRFRGLGEDGRWDTFDDWTANLSGAEMKQANLTGANLSRVVMNRVNLVHGTLNKANISLAILSNANLSGTQFIGANLHGAILDNASLTGADLGEANLTDANLYAAHLGRVNAIGAHLAHANLTKSDWQGADLSGADLSASHLQNANLSATRLAGTNFRDANLENVNLRNTDLSLTDLRGANLAGADLQGAIFVGSKSNRTDQFIQTPAFGTQSALVKGVDFTDAKNLNPKQIAYICNQGGKHPRCP